MAVYPLTLRQAKHDDDEDPYHKDPISRFDLVAVVNARQPCK